MARCHVRGAGAASRQEELASPTRPAPAPGAAHAPAALKVALPPGLGPWGATGGEPGGEMGGQGQELLGRVPQCAGGTRETLSPTQGSILSALEITQALELSLPRLEKWGSIVSSG